MLPLQLLLLISLVTANDIIGVSPEKQALYTPDEHGKWHCLSDPSIEISFSQINDDFCDCPDGSDEPGTNACAFTEESPKYFYCANKGFKEAFIENYKLNDGVCDYEICCDGSDEYKSGACPNVCDQVKTQYDEFLSSRKDSREKALRAKNKLQEKAYSMKQQLIVSADTLRSEIEEEEKRLSGLKEMLNQEEDGSNINKESSSLDTFVQDYSQRLENKFSQWQEHSKKTSDRLDALENMLNNLLNNYNPNFNDQAVKQAVASFADYISNKPETEPKPSFEIAEFSLEKITENLQKYVPVSETPLSTPESSFFNNLVGKARSIFAKEVVLDLPTPKEVNPKLSSEQTEKLNKRISDVEKSLTQKKAEESIHRDSIDENFGDSGIYRAVKNKWVNKKIGEYNYKLGYLDSLFQDNTLIGRCVGVQGPSMLYAHGSKCWNGPQRSARVDMICGVEHELISVSEPEKCQYRFIMTSPLACEELSDGEIAREFKVDRAKLTV